MKVAIVGCSGVPAAYGGFETLAENLVLYNERHSLDSDLTVYCSSNAAVEQPAAFHRARLHYLPLSANGVSSIVYDAWSMAHALYRRSDVLLVLGVSGAIAMPLLRCVGWVTRMPRMKIVTNVDGIEWRRAKWRGLARHFLRLSEWLAVQCSDVVVADNRGVAEHVLRSYGVACSVIAYGGDHAMQAEPRPFPRMLPPCYALALCRIEPENNVEMILEAFSRMPGQPLVFVGNWEASAFGREVRAHYRGFDHILMLDPEYDAGILKTLRSGASLYIHGHSAGGTNPSLVEMMHFGVPVAGFDCAFNRYTTNDRAVYFSDAAQLQTLVQHLDPATARKVGAAMQTLARQHYTWEQVGASYFHELQPVRMSDNA